MNVEKKEMLYEGKAKKMFLTDDPDVLWLEYKDDATAFDGKKKGTIIGKGHLNNEISSIFFTMLAEKGVKNHFIEKISDTEQLVRKNKILPLEVIVRNVAAGSLAKRLGLEEGTELKKTVLEYCYKSDELGDPMVNDYHIIACGWATREELDTISSYAFKINEFLKNYFLKINVELIDFKIEFGQTDDGRIILADEISPDTCRFWDATTHEKLDKDRFRRDLGGVEEAYGEMMKRIFG